jgi:hypothetical protein
MAGLEALSLFTGRFFPVWTADRPRFSGTLSLRDWLLIEASRGGEDLWAAR